MQAGAPVYVVVNSLLETRYEKKTGIPRVEYEIARYLAARGAQAIAWQRRRFVEVDFAAEIEAIGAAQSLDLDTVYNEPTRPSSMPRLRLALARVVEPLARRAPRWLNLSGAVHKLLAAEWSSLRAEERQGAVESLAIADDPRRLARFLSALSRRSVASTEFLSFRTRVDFQPGGLMIVIGTFWSNQPFEAIERLKASHDMRFIALMHDLIPLRRPEFFVDADGCARFRRHVDLVLKLADATISTSDYIARDLEAYARESGVTTRPVTAIPLCSDLRKTKTVHSARLRDTGLRPGGFALYVSSLNPRKNHQWAYLLWRRAVEEMGDAVPVLVFAGQRGWGAADNLAVMSRDGLMWQRKLIYLDSPTDGEVSWLYTNCAFSILPSMSEGWGLPITESLSFGKYCLAADNTSLPESGQGLTFHADPLDGVAWLAELRRLVREPGYVEAMNARVEAGFRSRSWMDVGGEVLALIARTRAAPSIESMRAPTSPGRDRRSATA